MKAAIPDTPEQKGWHSETKSSPPALTEFGESCDGDTRNIESSFYQYPAMMFPACQRRTISRILEDNPEVAVIADPFVGAGTVMVQAMLAGRAFVGQDINPLAIMIAKARSVCLDSDDLQTVVSRVLTLAAGDRSRKYARRFFNQKKWFSRGANIALSRLYRAISEVAEYKSRLFLWACLAETARTSSNSRTSTFKLHIRPELERCVSIQDVLAAFQRIARDNLGKVKGFASALRERRLLTETKSYKYPVILRYGDSSVCLPQNPLSRERRYDLVVTSPPYGDNRTTVTYGQAAWLPLQWIDLRDIGDNIPVSAVQSMYYTDNQSLGGRVKERTEHLLEIIAASSPAARSTINRLKTTAGDGLARFARFVSDLRDAIENIASFCHDDSWLVWTLGHRTISGVECPLADIVENTFAAYGIKAVARTKRTIASKHVAYATNQGRTMAEEYILVLRANRTLTRRHAATGIADRSTRRSAFEVPGIAA